MLQVFNHKGTILTEEVLAPSCGAGRVLVQNSASLISAGTELSGIHTSGQSLAATAVKNPDLVKRVVELSKTQGIRKTIRTVRDVLEGQEYSAIGYSSVGVVVERGEGVPDISVGDRVACAGAGYANHAEYVVVPRNLVARVPENVSMEEAATTTVGSIAMQGVRRASIQVGERVVVIGLGLIGQLTIQILKTAGCFTFGIDTNPDRVSIALRQGMNGGSAADHNDLREMVQRWTRGIGADAVIICAATESKEPLRQATEMIRKRGKIVLVGVVGMELPRSAFYEKEGDFLIATSYGPGRYDARYEEKGIDYPVAYVRWTENRNMESYLDLLASKKMSVKHVLEARFPVRDAALAYRALEENRPKPLGVLLTYQPQKIEPEKIKEVGSSPINKERIRVAVIGAGGFAQSVHLPNLARLPRFTISAVVDSSGQKAEKAARRFNARFAATDITEVLQKSDVDLVVITTRHNLHAPMVCAALDAKKSVFVEKPLAMNPDELSSVLAAQARNRGTIMVGFNRRFAPFSQKVKSFIERQRTPSLFVCRVNGGRAPVGAWVNDPNEGGGRMIGEACHFVDLLTWWSGSRPTMVFAQRLNAHSPDIINDDNVACTIAFENGSVAQLAYTTEGSTQQSKERFEIFVNGASLVLDDFRRLDFFGTSEKTLTAKKQDKGHYEEMRCVGEALHNGDPMPIPLEEAVRATRLTFAILESLRTNKAVMLA